MMLVNSSSFMCPRILWYLLLCSGPTSITVNSAFTALTIGPFALDLYKELRTAERPYALDPAQYDAQIRQDICEEIVADNEFLNSLRMVLVDTTKVLLQRHHPKYSSFFSKIYSHIPTSEDNEENYVYTNEYKLWEYTDAFDQRLEFAIIGLHQFADHLFVCLVEDTIHEAIIPYYISKEYNVSSQTGIRKPGRFVFGKFMHYPRALHHVMFAEEPVIAYTPDDDDDFDVEVQFLRIRTHVAQAINNDIDPLCKLVSGRKDHPKNQHFRLCVAVAKSSHFKNRALGYPDRDPNACSEEKVSFRRGTKKTENGEEAGRSFYERMTLCRFQRDHRRRNEDVSVFISRAYKSNQIFVYLRDESDGKIYLENLSTNVDIIDELNTFDFIED